LSAFLLLSEIALLMYSEKSGVLMGSEFIERSLSEIIITVKASMTLFVPVVFALVVLGIFIFLSYFLNRKKIHLFNLALIFIFLIFGSLYCINIDSLLKKDYLNRYNVKTYIVNKSWYCIKSVRDYVKWQQREKDAMADGIIKVKEDQLDFYFTLNPDRTIPDRYYPLERVDDIESTLSPFFYRSDTMPNIVFVIVESLGREWSGKNADRVSFTPFIDSLADESLFWKNCFSTTPRSFGAVPAITGSLPYGFKGFQFGNMPRNNTLISILKNNNYHTNVFYAGSFNFDAVGEYLIAQEVDYMSLFYEDYRKNGKKYEGTPWGYNDDIMYTKTIEELNSMDSEDPMFNMIITISSHDELNDDNPNFKYVFEQTDKIIETVSDSRQRIHKMYRNKIAGIVYSDNSLRDFFQKYKNRPDFENTIFVITGDHASEFYMRDNLSMFHVPLIIYSPLLKTTRQFTSIVSHNDITPSITALLRDNFNLKTSKYVSWVGTSLDTSSTFNSKQRHLFLRLAQEIKEMLYDKYYYNSENNALYVMNENADLIEVPDSDSLKSIMYDRLENLKYINEYVYNDRLTNYPIFSLDEFKNIAFFFQEDSLYLSTPEKQERYQMDFFPPIKIPMPAFASGWEKIKITLEADIKILDSLGVGNYFNIFFGCVGKNIVRNNSNVDKIIKYIPESKVRIGEWQKMNITRTFKVSGATDILLLVYFYIEDYEWVEKNRVVLKNISVKIEGLESKD
jgi:uncharacterized sulfatase